MTFCGAALGVALALWSVRSALAALPLDLSRLAIVAGQARALAATIATSVVSS